MSKTTESNRFALAQRRRHEPPTKRERRWKPSLTEQKCLLHYLSALPDRLLSKAQLAALVGVHVTTVRAWWRRADFATWWEREVMTALKASRHIAFGTLLQIATDPGVPARERVLAARDFAKLIPAGTTGRSHAIRELFQSMEAVSLPGPTQVRAAMRGEDGDELLVELVRREGEREEIEKMGEQGKKLGVVESSPTQGIDDASRKTIAALAARRLKERASEELGKKGRELLETAKETLPAKIVEDAARATLARVAPDRLPPDRDFGPWEAPPRG